MPNSEDTSLWGMVTTTDDHTVPISIEELDALVERIKKMYDDIPREHASAVLWRPLSIEGLATYVQRYPILVVEQNSYRHWWDTREARHRRRQLLDKLRKQSRQWKRQNLRMRRHIRALQRRRHKGLA